MTELIFRTSSYLGFAPPPDDEVEPIAALANHADASEGFRECTLRTVTLALGFAGAYLIESAIDADHRAALVAVKRVDRVLELLGELDARQLAALG
ncbi:MAG: hypothetical protein HOO96_38880, partial [Polyangiaceae bacterium]|nr:hypothetical protein [Polyangiaceae bacterium]